MTTLQLAVQGEGKASAPVWAGFDPSLCFWLVGLIVYGGASAVFAQDYLLDQISRDLWQHLATLRALIADPVHPVNPFVGGDDPSRHFNPYWVSIALLARLVGWNEWQAIAFAGFVSAGVILSGIWVFARAYYRHRAGPLALLAAMLLGWLMPVSHTGYHSLGTLAEGVAYPAALLIGLSLHLWAVVIRALEDVRWSALVAPLSAFMFATHQLGAGIGFMTASSLIVLWPSVPFGRRVTVATAMGAGLLISTLWPFSNPFELVRSTGNPSWTGGINFYSPLQLVAAFVPSALGLVGLIRSEHRRRALPIAIAFLLYLGLFALGLAGVLIATRFVMPAVLMLHIGLGALILTVARQWRHYDDNRRRLLFTLGCSSVAFYAALSVFNFAAEARETRQKGNAYAMMQALTLDIPDDEPIAAYDVAVWPAIATGQRAVSVPWPEPGIPDLATRQQAVETLFNPSLSKEERISLARRWRARVLIMNAHGPLRRKMPAGLVETLMRQSRRAQRAGHFIRFDLY